MKMIHVGILLVLLLAGSNTTADEIAVTIYNNNLGVVSELRKLKFNKGTGVLAFRNVPASIDAASVRFELVGDKGSVNILEQNYAFDLVSPQKLYGKYIDKKIELIDSDGRLFSGNLIAYNREAVTLMEESGRVKIVSLKNISEVSFPQLPDGLITRPTLFWRYISAASGEFESRVSYQTAAMSWSAEYVGVLDKTETGLDLSGWASITNHSGKTYKDAKLKLVAGDINRAYATDFRGGFDMGNVLNLSAKSAGFDEKSFFEYHLYTLPRKTTLANKEIKQISLFEPAKGSVEKIYIYKPESDPNSVTVAIEFVNSKKNGLGMPLPAGRVRLFKADDDGSLILLGEDRIGHTPKDEELKLTLGKAFDIIAEQRLAKQTRVSAKVDDREFEIELRNRKDEDVVVKVEKRFYGFWEILESSHEYKIIDANKVDLQIPVKAGETTILKIKVRFTTR